MAVAVAVLTQELDYNPEAEYTCYLLMIDGIEVGFANLEVGEYEAYLQDVCVFPKHKGKGYFTTFIKELFIAMESVDTIYCNHRNDESNPIFEKWASRQLGYDEEVAICWDGEKNFEVK